MTVATAVIVRSLSSPQNTTRAKPLLLVRLCRSLITMSASVHCVSCEMCSVLRLTHLRKARACTEPLIGKPLQIKHYLTKLGDCALMFRLRLARFWRGLVTALRQSSISSDVARGPMPYGWVVAFPDNEYPSGVGFGHLRHSFPGDQSLCGYLQRDRAPLCHY